MVEVLLPCEGSRCERKHHEDVKYSKGDWNGRRFMTIRHIYVAIIRERFDVTMPAVLIDSRRAMPLLSTSIQFIIRFNQRSRVDKRVVHLDILEVNCQ